MKFFSSTILYTRMSTNNVNIVNRNNWFQKMNTIGTQNVTNMVLSGTDSNVQMALISVANDVHYCYSNYPLSKTNGFTLTFQLYITGTNMNSICAYFGVTDPTTSFDANSGLANQLGAIELMIRPGGGSGGQSIFNTYANYSGSSSLGPTSATAVATGAWQTVKITYTPSTTATWVVNYNGTDIISYNDSSYTTFANNQNTVWGIYGSTANTVSASIRAVDLSVKQSMPLSVLKDTYSFYPEECYINKLSTNSQKNVAAAFALRLLEADYLGPLINVRRGSDNATLDFYADSKGNLGTNLHGNGTSLLGWLAGSIGYVTRWYDQSGNGRDVINTTTGQQPKIGTPILDTVSTKNTARGVYTLYRANSTYTGPTIKLRRSSDNAVSDFYADVYGNLINSTGTSFTSWISTSTAYVDTWYDQSGSGNHATQSTTAFQPVYNGTLKLIDSLNSSSLFLNMPSGTVPTGTLNAPYSFVIKHGNISNNAGTLVGAGVYNSNNQSNTVRVASAESAAYRNYWWFNDFDIGSPSDIVNGTTVTFTYNGTVQTGYINKGGADTLLKTTSGRTGGTTAAGQQSLFRNTNAGASGEYLNGQMYSVFIFGSALSDADRYACQANPTEINITYDGSQQLYAGSTNYPLNSGLDTYTYIADIKIGDISSNRNIITSGTVTNNNRASLVSVSGTYGFSGHNNDVFIIPTGSLAKRRIVMMCNHNLSSGNIVINDNGTMYTGTTTSPSALNVGNGFYIGTNGSSEYFIGNINEIIVFRNTLTTKESMLYFTPETITRKAYLSQPCLQINYLQKDIGPIPSGAIVQIDTQMLQNLSPGTPVTSWGGVTGINSPVLNAAIYTPPQNTPNPPYVSLTNSNSQYFDAGSKTFNINTNGGFTAVWFGRFIGTAISFERVFDFGNGQANNNIVAYRGGTTSNMNFILFNSSTSYGIATSGNEIIQNEWAVWTFRYTASTRLMEILKDGVVLVTGTAGAAITDRTLTSNRIGWDNWAGGLYSNYSIAGLYVYASFLTDAQVASISNHLMYSNSSIMPSILPDYNNKVVRYGSVLSQGFRDAQSMRFNGNVGSYLDIQDVPNWPFTFCFWFLNISTANTTPAALCSADLTGFGIQTDITSNGTVLRPYYSTTGSSWVAMTASAVALNVWYHITYVVTPTTLAYYLNGSLVQSVSAVVYNTNRIVIGKSGDNARPLNGYIHDVRVYDYALRADEISGIGTRQASQYGRNLLNYNMPNNYLVNVRNWYNSSLTTYKSGSYTIGSGLSDPDFTMQLTSNAVANSSNTLYNSTRIQNYNSFTCAFSMYAENVTEHGFYFYCGATALTTVPTCTIGTSANSGYYIYFLLAGSGTRGVYLFNNQGQQLAYYPFPNPALTSSNYIPITIVYNRSVTKTWSVNVANKDVLVFNDPNNENWVSNIAGDIWGIGARTTTSGMDCYIRRVELSYTPYENRLSTVANVQNNTKFPPGAMTADSTTFTGTGILDGVYTASISNGTEAGYKAFDNNTATFAGELQGAYNYSTGTYLGGVSTTVINLRDNTSTSYSGEWYQIQVPNAVSLNSFGIMGRQDANLVLERTPTTFYVAGSNNGSTWELIHSTSGAEYGLGTLYFTCNAGNTNKYRYFRLIANKLGNSGATIRREYFSVAAWDLFTQINTVNAAVIAVPPYSMTADTTTFSGSSLYDGSYTVTSSNMHSHNEMGPRYTIFDDTYAVFGKVWSPGPYYNGSTGVYTGSVSTTVSGVSQSGEWVQIQIPNPIVLYSFSLNFWWPNGAYWAKSFLIAGSNDNSTWTNIYNNTNATFVYSTAQTFVVTGSPNAYRYFRLIVRSTSGIANCDWWILDQWKLYTNASNVNLMKFPPAPLTADSPVTFTTVNTKNWYNVMSYINNGGGFAPVLSGSDPLKQLQLSNGSVGVRTLCSITGQPVMNYNSFTFSFGLYCANTNNGDYVNLIFGSGGNQVTFSFEIYAYAGIRLSTSSVSNALSSATNWYNSTWNNIRIVYNRSGTNTWTMFFNETQIIQYSDPNWYKSPGGQWGFDTYNGAAHFNSYIRQLEMTIAPVSLPGTSILSGNYTASASSNYIATVSTISSNAFNFTGNMWHSAITYSSGAYTGAVTTTVSGTSYSGEWLQLQAPNALQLSSFSIYPRQDSSLWSLRSPKNFVMAGSNDGSTWNLLHTATGVNDWTTAEKYFVCNGSNVADKYSYFRLITLALNGTSANADSVNFINLNLFTPISLNNAITPATPKGLLDGLTWKYYNGSSNNSVSYYTTNTYTNIGRCIDTTNINLITNGQYRVDGADAYSMEIFGYFRATVSGTYTFSLATDDGSYLWIGANALTGYTTSNANIQHPNFNSYSPITSTVTLLAGTYYPIRIHYYEGIGGDDLRFRFTPPGGTQTSNGQGYFFSGTGLDSAFPQESAKIIKDLTNTNTDGVYYILVNGISTPVHCLMNDCYDGGGWMMLMKGTRGDTFQYSSNYWTTKNTLNAGDLTRNDADAKYDTFNYSTVKDVLAIWPDIPSRSYTNPYGQNGGSIFVDDGWTWMVNNWNETTRITPFTGFTTSRLPHQNTLSATQTYGINNPVRYNGFGDWCSRQTGAYVHGFNRSGTGASGPHIRWGFLFNNETDLATCDVFCGIGMGGLANQSAGDYNPMGWVPIGINRTARFELYGR